jgi:hypothetical protein
LLHHKYWLTLYEGGYKNRALLFAGYFLGPTLTGIVSDMYGGVQYGMILCLGWSIFGFVFMLLAWFAAQWVWRKAGCLWAEVL